MMTCNDISYCCHKLQNHLTCNKPSEEFWFAEKFAGKRPKKQYTNNANPFKVFHPFMQTLNHFYSLLWGPLNLFWMDFVHPLCSTAELQERSFSCLCRVAAAAGPRRTKCRYFPRFRAQMWALIVQRGPVKSDSLMSPMFASTPKHFKPSAVIWTAVINQKVYDILGTWKCTVTPQS